MILKGIVLNKIGENLYNIDIPSMSHEKFKNLVASVSYMSNCDFDLTVGSNVYIEFVNNTYLDPVIIGMSNDNISNSVNFNSLIVNDSAKFSKDTSIGSLSADEVNCLDGLSTNVQDSINEVINFIDNDNKNLKLLDAHKSAIEDTYGKCKLEHDSLKSRVDILKSKIGNPQDIGNDTIYGRLNNQQNVIDILLKKIGKVEDGKTIVSMMSDLKSKLVEFNDKLDLDIDSIDMNDSQKDFYTLSQSNDFNSLLNALRSKYPNGKYWNRISPSQNNVDGYTSTPCKHHGDRSRCNNFEGAIQCAGFATKCGYDMTGYNPNSSNKWKFTRDPKAINNIKKGDLVRYRNDGHSMYVIDVHDTYVTVAECNWYSPCEISWTRNVKKDDIKSSFTYLQISPTDLSKSPLWVGNRQ